MVVESEVVDAAHRAAFRIMDVNLATSEEARSLVEAAKVVSVYVTRWDCASNTALHSILFPSHFDHTMAPSPETQALTRAYRPSPVLNKTTRQMVPPFVQKLYEFVVIDFLPSIRFIFSLS
jgi:hypothetical protein